jgi:hypothetical protein
MRSANLTSIPTGLRSVLTVLLAFVGILGTIQVSHAATGYEPFELKLVGEASVRGQDIHDSDSAYPSEKGYDLTPVTYSTDLAATGCSGTIALSATPAVLKTHARLQSDPGPGCGSSEIQASAVVTDTLRFWAQEANIGEPLRLDLEFEFSDS